MKQDVPPPMFRNVSAVASLAIGSLGVFSIVVQPAFGLLFGVVAVALRKTYHFGPRKISMYLKRYHDLEVSTSGEFERSYVHALTS